MTYRKLLFPKLPTVRMGGGGAALAYGATSVAQSGAARTIVLVVGFGRIGCAWHSVPRHVCDAYNNRVYSVHVACKANGTVVFALCCPVLYWTGVVLQRSPLCTSNNMYGSTGKTGGVVNDSPKVGA